LVAALAGGEKRGFDLERGAGLLRGREREGGRECRGRRGEQFNQKRAPCRERLFQQGAAGAAGGSVERKRNGDFAAEEKIVAAGAAEALLQFRERQRAAVAPREQFTIADEIAGQGQRGAGEIGELPGDALEIARVEFDAPVLFVDL